MELCILWSSEWQHQKTQNSYYYNFSLKIKHAKNDHGYVTYTMAILPGHILILFDLTKAIDSINISFVAIKLFNVGIRGEIG